MKIKILLLLFIGAISYSCLAANYTSVTSGPWNRASTWTPSGIPGIADNVNILNGHTITLARPENCASLTIAAGGTLDVGTFSGSSLGVLSGGGTVRISSDFGVHLPKVRYFIFPFTDFSGFLASMGTIEFYSTDGRRDAVSVLPSNITNYGNLKLSPKNQDNIVFPNFNVTINGDLTINGDKVNSWASISYTSTQLPASITKTVHVLGNIFVNGGSLIYNDDLVPQNLIVDGNLTVAKNQIARVDVRGNWWLGGGIIANTLRIGGNLINNNIFRLKNHNRYCNLTFFGDKPSDISKSSDSITVFNNVVVNKQAGQLTNLIGSNSIDVFGNWTDSSTFVTSNTSTIVFKGNSTLNDIGTGSGSFANILVEGTLTVNDVGSGLGSFTNIIVDGILNAPSSNLNILGNVEISSTGAFNSNGGTVVFKGTDQTITSQKYPIIFNNLTINVGTTVNLPPNSMVTVNNNTIVNGKFIIHSPSDNGSSASFININPVSGTGTSQVERYFTAGQFHYLASPVQDPAQDLSSNAKSDLFTMDGGSFNPNFYSYNEAKNLDGTAGYPPYDLNELIKGWVKEQPYSNSTVNNILVKKGYAFTSTNNTKITFKGKLNTGDMTISNLTHTVNDPIDGDLYDGWNLIGNPYTSAIDWKSMESGFSNIDETLYIWNGESNSYGSYVPSSGFGINNVTNIIAPMQGFFVHARVNNASISLNELNRVHNSTSTFKSAVQRLTFIKLKVETPNGKSDETVVYFHPDASPEFDGKFDALAKFSWDMKSPGYYNYEDIPNLYTITPNLMQIGINALPESSMANAKIPLGLRLGSSGQLKISKVAINVENINVYLVDKLNNKSTLMNRGDSYKFDFIKGDVANRFELRFKENNPPVVAHSLQNRQYDEGKYFSFSIPKNTFADNDESDSITGYYANIEEIHDIPEWMSFDPKTLTFSGTPGYGSAGIISLTIKATDLSGSSVFAGFKLTILNVNNPPRLIKSIPDQEIDGGSNYTYSLSKDLFIDIDYDDRINYSSKLANSNGLPTWLTFDNENMKFSGVNSVPGIYNIIVTATDNYGASQSDEFVLSVKSITGIEDKKADDFQVFPNPTDGIFYINDENKTGNYNLIIRDLNGKTIKSTTLHEKVSEVNLKPYANGTYIIEINDGKQKNNYKLILRK